MKRYLFAALIGGFISTSFSQEVMFEIKHIIVTDQKLLDKLSHCLSIEEQMEYLGRYDGRGLQVDCLSITNSLPELAVFTNTYEAVQYCKEVETGAFKLIRSKYREGFDINIYIEKDGIFFIVTGVGMKGSHISRREVFKPFVEGEIGLPRDRLSFEWLAKDGGMILLEDGVSQLLFSELAGKKENLNKGQFVVVKVTHINCEKEDSASSSVRATIPLNTDPNSQVRLSIQNRSG